MNVAVGGRRGGGSKGFAVFRESYVCHNAVNARDLDGNDVDGKAT